MEGHRGTRRQALTEPKPCSNTDKIFSFVPFYTLNFSNNFLNFSSFQSALAAVSQLVVSSSDVLAGLRDLHSEALADILDMEIEYDILELSPPIEDEPPQWMVNFINSDREPAESGDASPPRGVPDLPLQDPSPEPLPELTWEDLDLLGDSPAESGDTMAPPVFPDLPLQDTTPSPSPPVDEPYMPDLPWEDYLMVAGLEEVEQMTDTEDMPSTTSPALTPPTYSPVSPSIHQEDSPVADICTDSSAEPESSLEYQIQRRNWISKEKVKGNGACPVENMLSLIPEYYQPESTFVTFDKEFGIPKHLMRRWRNGVRLWPDVKFSKTRAHTRDDQITDEIVKRLLKANIIKTTNARPYGFASSGSVFEILNKIKYDTFQTTCRSTRIENSLGLGLSTVFSQHCHLHDDYW